MTMRQAILFDLDGTLLPMDLDQFVERYFGLLARCFPEYDSKQLQCFHWNKPDRP